MALVLEPFPYAELVFCSSQQLWLLLGVDAALLGTLLDPCLALRAQLGAIGYGVGTYVVEDEEDFALL